MAQSSGRNKVPLPLHPGWRGKSFILTVRLIPPLWLRKVTLWLAIATAGSILLGVAWSQILMGVTLVALLLSGLPMRWPRIARPLALFLIWTLIALAASPDPVGGLAQVRKI